MNKVITYIYLVENCFGDPNKVYIGKTKNNRKRDHKNTYGKEIIYTIIDEINSLFYKDWEPLESYWIEQFRQWGFEVVNKRKKGGSGPEFQTERTKLILSNFKKGTILSQKTKNKISKSNKGISRNKNKKFSKESKIKISNAKKGHSCFTEERNQKISESLRKNNHSKYYTNEIKNKISQSKLNGKIIIQLDLNNNIIKEWYSISSAKSILGGDIQACLSGKQKTACGFKWKYKENE